jgi:hypothetical protein
MRIPSCTTTGNTMTSHLLPTKTYRDVDFPALVFPALSTRQTSVASAAFPSVDLYHCLPYVPYLVQP